MSLGCYEEGILRFIRSGRVFYSTEDFNCSWGRRNDDVSTGTFTLASSKDCCPAEIHARADMVEFERNGIVEWAGYCMKPVSDDGVLTVNANDLLEGYRGRIIRNALTYAGVDITTIASDVLTSADSIDPVPVVPVYTATGLLADRLYTIAEHRIAWDALFNDLLKVGLDMTMVGTLLYMGPVEARNLRPMTINERMIDGIPQTGEDGAAYANRIIAHGAGGLVSIYPAGPPTATPPYPLVEAIVDAPDALDQATLDEVARQHYELRSSVPRFVAFGEGVGLREDSPYELREYIPGRLVQTILDTTCIQFSQAMRLQSLDYTLTSGKEEIKIATVPTGSVPAGTVA